MKLLVICGPTATGKTALAIHLSKVLGGEIISADSRQVFKYMNIGTGKEFSGEIKICGYDLVGPDQDFSVSHFLKFANEKITSIEQSGKLPILVGGTGLYIDAVVGGIETADIKPDEKLRHELEQNSVTDLQKILQDLNFEKYKNMNNSDKNNPRRLIRAIEIMQNSNPIYHIPNTNYDVLWIGLTASKEILDNKIRKRVEQRIADGFVEEVEFLKRKGFWDGAPSRTIGYKDWPDIEKWQVEEIKYAKRQMTWFKKNKAIKWFDVSIPGFQKEVEKLAKRWYDSNHAKES